MKKIAVVILNYNGRHYLEKFLPSVTQYSKEAEVVIADNASTDDSVRFLQANYPHLRLILLSKNEGFSRGYNLALAQIEATYYVLLNSDVEVTPQWLTAPTALLEEYPQMGACQPKLKAYHDKSYFEYAGAAGGFLDYWGYPFCRGRLFLSMEKDEAQYEESALIFWATGACMFVRSSLYHQLGGLEEDFFAHMEEIDFCWRLQSAGYDVGYTPESEVFHVGGGTLSASNPRKTFLNFRNNLAMLCKNLPSYHLFRVLTARLFLDTLASLKFLLGGNQKDFLAVWKAYYHFYSHFFSWRKKGRAQRIKRLPLQIWSGSLLYHFYVKKSKKFTALKVDQSFIKGQEKAAK